MYMRYTQGQNEVCILSMPGTYYQGWLMYMIMRYTWGQIMRNTYPGVCTEPGILTIQE